MKQPKYIAGYHTPATPSDIPVLMMLMENGTYRRAGPNTLAAAAERLNHLEDKQQMEGASLSGPVSVPVKQITDPPPVRPMGSEDHYKVLTHADGVTNCPVCRNTFPHPAGHYPISGVFGPKSEAKEVCPHCHVTVSFIRTDGGVTATASKLSK